jgi:hypothetical protein
VKLSILPLCLALAGCALYERNLTETTSKATCMTDAIRITPGIESVSTEKLGPYYALIEYTFRDRDSVLQTSMLELAKIGDRYLGTYNSLRGGDPFLRGPSIEHCGVPLGYPDQPLARR